MINVILINDFLLAQFLMFSRLHIHFITNQKLNTSISVPNVAWIITMTVGIVMVVNNPLRLRKEGIITVTMETVFNIRAAPIRVPWLLNLRHDLAVITATNNTIPTKICKIRLRSEMRGALGLIILISLSLLLFWSSMFL